MGAASSKTALITKPAQGGKDRSVVDLIKEHQLHCDLFQMDEMITIIFHGLAKALGSQKSARMAGDKETFETDKILLWNSGGAGRDGETEAGIRISNCSAKELFADIVSGDTRYILCCDVPRRWEHVMSLCQQLDRYAARKSFPGLRIVIDEADARMSTWQAYGPYLAESLSIKEVVLVTATSEPILNRYGQLKIRGELNPIDLEKYVGCADQEFILKDILHSDAFDYITTLLESPDISCRLVPGSIWFAPADLECASHRNVKDLFISKNANVVVVNGTDKKIYTYDGRVFDIADEISEGKDELGQILKRYYNEPANRFKEAPFVITGNLCIERGISFQDSNKGEFLFDTALVADISNRYKAYQTTARMFGNIKHVRGLHRGVIFTTSAMKKKCEQQERIAIKLNEIGLANNGIVTKEHIKHIKSGRPLNVEKCHFVCDSFEEAQEIARRTWNAHLTTANREYLPDGSPQAPFELRKTFYDSVTKTFQNPTTEYLLNRFYGLDKGADCRAYPVKGGKWLLYGYVEYPIAVAAPAHDLLSEDPEPQHMTIKLKRKPACGAGGPSSE